MAPNPPGAEVTSSTSSQLPPIPSTFPHSLPPPVLRLLSLSSPWVNALHSFIHLATWTQPQGGGTHSVLLLLAWTFVCLFAYPVLRYAPQLLVLGLILTTAVPNVLLRRAGSRAQGGSAVAQATLTQKQTEDLLQKLSDILDVTSTLHARVVLPLWQALTWQHPQGHSVTIGAAIMATSLGTVWTLCFADWPRAWSKLVVLLPLGSAWNATKSTISLAKLHIYDAYLKAQIESRLSSWPMLVDLHRHILRAHAFIAPRIWNPFSSSSSGGGASIALPWFPPFPLFSLDLSHALLTLGLIALSWCSTYATLVRHALWKSAAVRSVARGAVRAASFGYLGARPHQLSATALAANSRAAKSSASASSSSSKSESPRINTVPYRFELYENQRWWMGLDWTAALLPQERASWTDSSLSPVSPPASFTLPAESVSWRPKPTKKKPNAWEKRVIRWKWEEEEWRVVVNVGGGLGTGMGEAPDIGATGATPGSPSTPSRRRSSGSSAAGAGGSTLFSSFSSRNTPSSVDEEDEDLPTSPTSPRRPSSENTSASGAAAGSPFSEDTSLPTDASGWRYGDNGWDKMTNKSGMGKYTRRRKWVRRARMEEVVFEGVERPPADQEGEKGVGEKAGEINGGGSSSTDSAVSSTSAKALSESPAAAQVAVEADEKREGAAAKDTQLDEGPPASPSPAGAGRGDLKSRLASAAGGSGGGGGS